MDSTLILNLGSYPRVVFDISDFSSGRGIRTALADAFAGCNIDNIEATDMADFPDSIFNLPTDEKWDTVYNYYQAARGLSEDNRDAFKAFYESEGGTPTDLVTEFNNRYAGDFKDLYDFGVDRAEACSIQLAGNDSFFMFEAFGEAAVNDYEVLEDRYYFRR